MKVFTRLSLALLLGVPTLAAAVEQEPYVAIYDNVIQANADSAVSY